MGAGRFGEEEEWGEDRLQTGRGFAESGEDLGFYPKGSKEGEGINRGWGGETGWWQGQISILEK